MSQKDREPNSNSASPSDKQADDSSVTKTPLSTHQEQGTATVQSQERINYIRKRADEVQLFKILEPEKFERKKTTRWLNWLTRKAGIKDPEELAKLTKNHLDEIESKIADLGIGPIGLGPDGRKYILNVLVPAAIEYIRRQRKLFNLPDQS